MSFDPLSGMKSLVFSWWGKPPSPPLPPETCYPRDLFSQEIEEAITENEIDEFEYLCEKKGASLPKIIVHSRNVWVEEAEDLGTLNKVSELVTYLSRKMKCPPDKICLRVNDVDLLDKDLSVLDKTIVEVFLAKKMSLQSTILAIDSTIAVPPLDLEFINNF